MNPLEQAKANIRKSLGLSNVPSDWTYEQRIAYNSALSTYILNNQSGFSNNEVEIAKGVANSKNVPLDDNGILSDLSTFGDAFSDELSNAGESIAGIGKGFLTLANLSRWVIPIAGISAVIILLFALQKKFK